MSRHTTLPGFREFYPEDKAVQNHIHEVWRRTSRRFGFQEWDAPVLEPLELFTEKSGEEIVTQLFNFTDKGDRAVTLRPEMTPSLARMVGARANGMRRPVKWFAIGENFRYEKQQKGRLRSFVQYNADILGEAGPAADAEAVALLIASLRAFGLKAGEFHLRLSDRTLWFLFLESLGVPADKAPGVLAVVDKLERDTPEQLLANLAEVLGETGDAGKILAAVREFTACDSLEKIASLAGKSGDAINTRLGEWRELLALLDAMDCGPFVKIDLTIVRGLAYYTGFVFEAFGTAGRSRALAGGGRYDNLVKKLGGPDMPAVGFGMGDVVLRNLLDELKLLPVLAESPDFYAMILGEENRHDALAAVSALREAGFSVEYAMKDGKFGKLIQTAEQSGAKFALIFGSEERAAGVVKVRDVAARAEITAPREHLVAALRDIAENGLPKNA